MSTTAQTPLQTQADNSDVEYVRQSFNRMVALVDAMNSRVLASAAVATGTTTSKVKTVTNPVAFIVDGAVLSKAAADDFWTLTGATFAAGLSNKWLLLVDAAGAASVAIGTPAATLAAVVLPAIPTSKAVFGVLNVVNATNPFIPGTTLLGAAGVTATYTQGNDPLYVTGSTVVSPVSPYLVSSHK